jgi:hypothetical protein
MSFAGICSLATLSKTTSNGGFGFVLHTCFTHPTKQTTNKQNKQARIDSLKTQSWDKSTLWVFAVREACHWIDGMFRKQWHRCDSAKGCSGGYTGFRKPSGSRMYEHLSAHI